MSTARGLMLSLPCVGVLACAPPWTPLQGCTEADACAAESSSSAGETTAAATTGSGGGVGTGTEAGGSSTMPEDGTTGGDVDTTADDTSTGDEPEPAPTIHVVDMPLKIHAAGPALVRVFVEHAWSVRGVLDGQETISFAEAEPVDGVDTFEATLSIFGSVDDGKHALEVIAERGDLEDRRTRPFEVATPAAGTLAWEGYGGPGSIAPQLVVSPTGRVFEGGAFGLGGVQSPSLRLRDAQTGAELIPGGSLELDPREGTVADLALAPEGRLWVAMNVREGGVWRARIGLYESNAEPLEIALEKPGATVTAIDNDGAGGCFAVGYTTTIHGDTDVLIWRLSGEGVPIFSGQAWDYPPEGFQPHDFTDLAFDVVVDPVYDEAWIVGTSQGKHDWKMIEARGLILRVDLDTLEQLGPVIVAPPAGPMTQSVFYGAALDAEGIFVTGNRCDQSCASQQLVVAHYNAAGLSSWNHVGEARSVAFGSRIARTRHGLVLVAGNVKDGATMLGMLLGFDSIGELFSPVVFPGKGASRASSVAVGPYDWAFVSGLAAVGGEPQAYVMHPHL